MQLDLTNAKTKYEVKRFLQEFTLDKRLISHQMLQEKEEDYAEKYEGKLIRYSPMIKHA